METTSVAFKCQVNKLKSSHNHIKLDSIQVASVNDSNRRDQNSRVTVVDTGVQTDIHLSYTRQ